MLRRRRPRRYAWAQLPIICLMPKRSSVSLRPQVASHEFRAADESARLAHVKFAAQAFIPSFTAAAVVQTAARCMRRALPRLRPRGTVSVRRRPVVHAGRGAEGKLV